MRDRIIDTVCGAIRELNGDLGYDHLNSPTLETELYGGDSGLDSLSLVMLVSAVEAAVADNFGREVVLASEKAMSMRHSPYRSVGSFVEFIEAELAQ
ncbi:acyl carrier protein [Novosphingobium endophyticum]|nr:acyl carrier protein [Novosphingobium endophyticum]